MRKKRALSALLAAILVILCAVSVGASDESPGYHARAQAKAKQNGDTVGWLRVPGTGISDVVVQSPDGDNNFYLRRDFAGNYSYNGSLFADFRSTFGSGRDSLSRNTLIYGNSSSDDANGEMFSRLKRYRSAAFARENPVIYFATTEETFAWQVFAVSVVRTEIPYNIPNPTKEQYDNMLGRIREASIHDYSDIEVTTGDKLLTLSTMDYSIEDTFPSSYRFVVMAKLIEES